MTTNLRLLSKRKLPPLDLSHNHILSIPYNLKFITRNAIIESLHYNDLSSDIITKYLDNNHVFLENYLLNNLKFRASYKLASIADSLINEAPFDGITQHISLELKKSASASKSDVMLFTEHAPKASNSIYPPFNNRYFFIQKLTSEFDETFPRASILKSLYECMMQGFEADEIKFYLLDTKNENLYLYDPFLKNNETQSQEVFPLNSTMSLAAAAAFYNSSVLYPNMRMNLFTKFHKFKSDHNIMAQPITDYNGSVYGVFQLKRSKEKPLFNKSDEEVALNFITWGSIALFFTDILQKHSQQQQLNNFIMKVTETMFCNFKHMDYVIMDIMKYAKHIVKAQRSAFFIVEKESKEIVAQIFDVGNENDVKFKTEKHNIRFPIGVGIAGHVAATGEILNIHDAYNDIRFNRDIDAKTGYITKSLVAIPIKLKNETVGVLQIVNKIGGYFNESDEEHLTTFASYCGIALYIAKMYRRIRHSEQKYKVALDVLSYHSGFEMAEFIQLEETHIPLEWPDLSEYSYCPWDIDEINQLAAFLFMFRNLFGIFNVEETEYFQKPRFHDTIWRFEKKTLMRFILTVKKNYRKVAYHNWSHAFTVGQSMYCMLIHTNHEFTVIESLALFIGCFCHDLDHRGKTNEYTVKSDDALGSLYSTSTMEHHHFNMTVSILQREDHNIFENMSSGDYKHVLDLIKHNILATDLNRFFESNANIKKLVTENEVDWKNESQRYKFMELFMTSGDLSAMYKPWDMQLNFVKVIMQEFWDQGDLEKKQGSSPARMMDRSYNYELPNLEIGFITFICVPCYTTLDKIVTGAFLIVDGLQKNLEQWKKLKELSKEEIIKMFP